jgi:hypothetical protein
MDEFCISVSKLPGKENIYMQPKGIDAWLPAARERLQRRRAEQAAEASAAIDAAVEESPVVRACEALAAARIAERSGKAIERTGGQ